RPLVRSGPTEVPLASEPWQPVHVPFATSPWKMRSPSATWSGDTPGGRGSDASSAPAFGWMPSGGRTGPEDADAAAGAGAGAISGGPAPPLGGTRRVRP